MSMDLHTQKEQFRKGIKKGPMAGNKWTFINSEELFYNAVYQAYLDAARTFHNVDNSTAKDAINTVFPKKLAEYFSNPAPQNKGEFDLFHKDTCTDFIEKCMSKGFLATYGQAQKIINMTFKYLYCCDGAPEEYFTYCHMPLDSFILEWVRRKDTSLKATSIDSWSKLDNSATPQKMYPYHTFVDKIRTIAESEKTTPLRLELTVWPEIQLKLAAESFLFALRDDLSQQDRKSIKDKTIENNLSEINREISMRNLNK